MNNRIMFRQIIAGVSSFDDAIDRLVREGGLSRGRAIIEARRINGKAYNSWMEKRQRGGMEPQRGGGSFMRQNFRFIGA